MKLNAFFTDGNFCNLTGHESRIDFRKLKPFEGFKVPERVIQVRVWLGIFSYRDIHPSMPGIPCPADNYLVKKCACGLKSKIVLRSCYIGVVDSKSTTNDE